MIKEYINDMNFSNKLLKEQDFSFIYSLDKELEDLQAQLAERREQRDSILLNISKFSDELSDEELTEYEKILNVLNDNIDYLSSLETLLRGINQMIINFLNFVETSSATQEQIAENLQEIKDSAINYTNELNDSKEKLEANNLKINTFFENFDIDKYEKKEKENKINEKIETYSLQKNIKELKEVENLEKDNENKIDYSKNETSINQPEDGLKDNNILRISEKEDKVYLPYTISEVKEYIKQYPESYKSVEDVIRKEYVLSLEYYMKHPVVARFREAYVLIRDKEAKSVLEALEYAFSLMFKYELNPAIIAACKTEEQLDRYLECLEEKN